MRITVDNRDPDFIGSGNAGRYKVTIDGFPVPQAIEADDQAGYVIAWVTDDKGQVVLNAAKSEPERTTHRGRVRIIDTRAP